MSSCKRRVTHKNDTCDRLLEGGMCELPELFRCTEYMERLEPRLSHSGITNFIRCPMMYYYSNVMGLQVRPEFQGDPLKIGIAVDDYITNILMGGKPSKDTLFPKDEIDCMWKAKAVACIRAFRKLMNIEKIKKMYTGQKEFLLQSDGQPSIKGYIDLESATGKSFVELKCGKNPAYYTQLFYIRSKLAAYFLSSKTYQSGTIWAIRVPALMRTKKFKGEPFPDYSARCYRVMIGEPSHYFPGYDQKTGNFGVKFGRAEIDLIKTAKTYRMVADYIKLAIKKDLWLQNGTGCLHPFECDYLSICETNGAVSDDVFMYREKETRKGKLQS